MNKQQIFDVVSAHLLKQGECSIGAVESKHGDVCAYRGASGLRCAIGVLIPDDLYSPEFEGSQLMDLPWKIKRAVGFNTAAKRTLLCTLQKVHDNVPSYCWDDALQYVAEDFGLKFTAPA